MSFKSLYCSCQRQNFTCVSFSFEFQFKELLINFDQVYINNEYDTSTMASLDNSDDEEDEAEDEDDEDDDDDDDDMEEDKVKEKMVFSSSAGERMLISISGDR